MRPFCWSINIVNPFLSEVSSGLGHMDKNECTARTEKKVLNTRHIHNYVPRNYAYTPRVCKEDEMIFPHAKQFLFSTTFLSFLFFFSCLHTLLDLVV